MMRSSFVSALAAISLVAAPTASIAATSGSASALSIANSPAARAGADLQDPNNMDTTGWVIVGAAAVAALIIILVLLDDDDEDFDSP
jgi:hypothetical protein